MALELKDVLKVFDLSIDDPDKLTIEQLQELRDGKFVHRDTAHQDEAIIKKITGKAIGSIETAVVREFKALGAEFEPGEVKDKKLEDIIALGSQKVAGRIKTIEEQANQGNDEKLTTLTEENKKLAQRNRELSQSNKDKDSLFAQKEQEFNGKLKETLLGYKVSEIKSKIPLSENAGKYAIVGFDKEFSEQFRPDFDENENLIIVDAKEGKQIKNPASGGFYTYEEVYKQKLEEAKLAKVNGTTQTTTTQQRQTTITQQQGTIAPNPNAVAATGQYNLVSNKG
jgi:hypothetical protein